MMTDDDRHLMRRLAASDETALARLLELHWPALVRYAYAFLGDWDLAEDVSQGAYARLWADRERWREGRAAPLLHRIVRNAALDVLKSPRHAARAAVPPDLVGPEAPADDLHTAEIAEAAAAAVAALPPRRREVFRLSRERGFSYDEIAQVTGLSRQTVANHMSLALSDLRVMLRPFLETADPDERAGSGDEDGDATGRGGTSR